MGVAGWRWEGVGMPDEEAPVGADDQVSAPRGFSRVRRRSRVALLVAVVIVVGLGVGVPLGVLTSSPKPTSGPGVSTSSVTGPQPSLLLKQLWNISEGMAWSGGDPGAKLRQAVGPVPYDKTDTLMGGGPDNDSDLVFLVEIGGRFFCGGCGRGVHGRAETSILLASTLQTEGGGIGPWVGLGSLGKPLVLPRPPAGADLWTVPAFSPFLGMWAGEGATLELRNSGVSTLRWGTHYVDFKVVWLTAYPSGEPTVRHIGGGTGVDEPTHPAISGGRGIGTVTGDDVGLASDSAVAIVLIYTSGANELLVEGASKGDVTLPSPLKCVQLASGANCRSRAS